MRETGKIITKRQDLYTEKDKPINGERRDDQSKLHNLPFSSGNAEIKFNRLLNHIFPGGSCLCFLKKEDTQFLCPSVYDFQYSFIWSDTETSQVPKNPQLLEVSFVDEITNDNYDTLVYLDPSIPIHKKACHNITHADLKDAPKLEEVREYVSEYMDKRKGKTILLLCHGSYDKGVFSRAGIAYTDQY